MRLTLFSSIEFVPMTLPEKCAGHYWVRGRKPNGKITDLIAVEAITSSAEEESSCWQIKSNRRYRIYDTDNNFLQNAELSDYERYIISDTSGTQKFLLYTEPHDDGYGKFTAFQITASHLNIKIGRAADNQIVFDRGVVSTTHAEIVVSGKNMAVRDLDSTNHTYVNGKAVSMQRLHNGDSVYIIGLHIIVTEGFLFINHPRGLHAIHCEGLKEYLPPFFQFTDDFEIDEEVEEIPTEYYYRAPRLKYDIEKYELKLDAPPTNQIGEELPLIMTVGPSMTMGMAAVASGAYSVTSAIGNGNVAAAIPSLVMCCSMLLGTLMWPIITKTYQKRRKREKEAKRQEKYSAYLAETEEKVRREIAKQETLLRSNDAGVDACVDRILSPSPRIWERTHKHTDFLTLRLGLGNIPFYASIQYTERHFSLDDDNLTEQMYRFGEQKRYLQNVPVRLKLPERFVSGFYGERKLLLSYAKNMILQTVALHAYDEVSVIMIYDERDELEFSFVRWLPHTMDQERGVRYIVTNPDEAKELSASLGALFENRKSLSESDMEDECPYFVVFCLDKELAVKTECVRSILENKKNVNCSVVALYERLEDLPKECSAVIALNGGTGKVTLIDDVCDQPVEFALDKTDHLNMDRVTEVLANTEIDLSSSHFSMPRQYTFFEMLNVGKVEHLNILDNWHSHDPVKSLSASVGIDRHGEPFYLDLHENAHGPHGLVAGMTGSGKSEFIIAFILSMAINYHPYEVAFILIDYKGGGMAKAFETIPHTAGVITNLDGNGIQRSLSSMRSELHRREGIFAETTLHHNVSNIDIYKYQKLYREGKVQEPLPHLFIISDEFAELKKEQPDFMTELTSTSRVGRSLGVHLILATQKPGGVVDDQIRSNSRFRVCLKVQDNADSNEMLARPDAAYLTNTGRFYLQVGNDELFEMGQSAWAGAPYYPSQRVIKNRDDAVTVINANGRVIAEANTDRFAKVHNPPKQLDVLTDYISKISAKEGIQNWKMWLEPIPASIYVDQLSDKYQISSVDRFILNPIVGEMDDPAHQRQDVLRVPLSADGNVIVYGSAGNGKGMFLEAMCYSLMRTHTPREVNFYLLDFDTELLTAFSDSPHVGDVILSHETEKVNNLFKLLSGKLSTRKKLLSGFGGDLGAYNKNASQPQPNLVIMIHNYAVFAEQYEDLIAQVNYLSREGTKYGIFFVLTCTGVNQVRLNIRQNFKLLYCLQLNSADDYSSVVGRTGGMVPGKYKGRGMFRKDKDNLLEFQVARITEDDIPYDSIRTFVSELTKEYHENTAQPVPVLPEEVTGEYLSRYCLSGQIDRIPIGVEKETLDVAYISLLESPVSMVFSEEQEWGQTVSALAEIIANRIHVHTVVLAAGEGQEVSDSAVEYHADINACANAVSEIFDTVLFRNNTYKDAIDAGEKAPEFEPMVVIIRSISQLHTMLGRYKNNNAQAAAEDDTVINRLFLAMEKCDRKYGVYFIVAESVNLITPFTAETWYKRHVSGNRGVWIGNGISNQFRLSISKKPQGFSENLGPDFGFVVRNAVAVLIKLLH
ncbi:MAG: type VII secretion protein EssC [Lachnospiraceae bacterium]|nr:type VII secretion protein EssC [Lachnospiraceae bacterium]